MKGDNETRLRATDRAMQALFLIWAFGLVAPLTWACSLALRDTEWKRFATPASDVALAVLTLAALACLTASVLMLRPTELRARLAIIAVSPGIFLGLSPVIVRALMHWEDPDTGAGSPLAVGMGILIGAVLFGAPVLISGLLGLAWLIGLRTRLDRAGDAPTITP